MPAHKVDGIQGVWKCQKIKTSSHVNIKHITFLKMRCKLGIKALIDTY